LSSNSSEPNGVIGWAATVSASPLMDLPSIKGQVQALHSAYPKITFGLPITEMEPDVQPIAMEST
jgi:hypothetical protein